MKPDAFAAVMAAGIVSIAAADHGYRIVSQILLVVAAVALPLLVVMVATSWRQESWDITDLDVALGLSTYVAACAVLAARLAEYHIALLVLAGMARRSARTCAWRLGACERCNVRISHRVSRFEDPASKAFGWGRW